jgi:hypothetical protein
MRLKSIARISEWEVEIGQGITGMSFKARFEKQSTTFRKFSAGKSFNSFQPKFIQ